jgi:hypothetical protein
MKNVEINNEINNDIKDSSKSKSKSQIQINRVNIFIFILFIPYLG